MTAITNRFPPHHAGGYGLRLADLATALGQRGHRVCVVTSTAGVEAPRTDPGPVHRILTLHGPVRGWEGILSLARTSIADGRRLSRALLAEAPEVILVGNFLGLSSALWSLLRAAGAPLVLDVSNEWLLELLRTHGSWFRQWERRPRGRLRRLAKRAAAGLLDAGGPPVLRTRFPGLGARLVTTTSLRMAERLREAAGTALGEIRVCRSGIDLSAFPFRPSTRPLRRLLYVGRLKRTKGVHTALRALTRLDEEVRLTVVGIPDEPGYPEELAALARERGLEGRWELRPPCPRSAIPAVFQAHDALVFPSEWEEPFSRLLLEALACGLPVIATPRGGTPELLRDGENGLLFPAGDPAALAAAVSRLAGDGELRKRLTARGRWAVEREYGLDAAADRLEACLRAAAEGG